MKTRLTLYIFTLLSFLSYQLFAQDIYINLNQPRQGIDGAGFCHEGDRQNGDYYVINTSIQQMLDNHMSLFRDMFPNKVWEPSKGTFNYSDARVVNSFQRLKTMQNKGIKTILGIWDVPNWMVSNPSAGSNRKINNFDDFAYFITSFLVHGKNNYGLTVDYIDINETKTSGINISLTAQEYITLIQKCETLFAANGIQTKMSLGSVLLWDIQYCKDIYNAVKNLSVAGNPTWHSYRGGSTSGREPISYWEGWGAWQQTLDRNLWGTETDYDAFYWENPDRLTWQGVEEMAVMYYRNYYVARMSTSAGWFWHPEWPSNNVHTAYMNHFEPGGQVVETSQPNSDVMTVAYKHVANKKFVIQAVNQDSSAHTVTFHGIPANKPLTLIRTSEAGDRYKTVGTYSPNGTDFTITLQANSFNTFYGTLETVIDTEVPGVPANFRSTTKTSTSISLAWDASTDNIGVSGYQIFNTSNVLAGSSTTTSTTLQNLSPNTSYTLLVKAYDAAGNFSAGSNAITVTTDSTQSGTAAVYADCNYSGKAVSLPVGNYTLSQLQGLGVVNDDISSVQVKAGYKITLFADNNFTGTSVIKTADDNCLVDDNFNDIVTSIKVEISSSNLAYNRPVFTTSNEDATNTGDKAVDANGNTRWSSSYANNQSIIVDLGTNYNVSRVRLAWEAAYARDYQIQFSTDNVTWTTIREFWGKASSAADDQTGLTGVARYVKVYCINRATSYGFSLFEFEIYGTPAITTQTIASISKPFPDEKDNAAGISIFPNPAHDQVTIQVPSALQKGGRISLINNQGYYIINRTITGRKETLQLTSLPAGLYLLKIFNNNGQITRKIIKE
ncbi:Por secretion system C-terminal sorting domain-containing protein [Chitinophaga sp. CF118]|uniref:discoidin domain-containing protein n=1 Tax=Chitinophaga sp. CF118 TaxID=1884367 RepID=UPI0008F3A7AD|nr:discoidin domain-containing protein [Chitinophaga sp. CF118]SFE09002.1 Por secretion system C-terminal sorting domain-containing protein [Chitinophaga sp. CF118]